MLLSLWLVATISRTSRIFVQCDPTRSTASSCTTRRSLDCAAAERSVTSSRKTVPSFASSNLPARPRTPVAVRSSMPNSSASTSVSTMAAQLTATNGPARRVLCSWICRATSSLPDPLSPSISTAKSVVATRAIRSRNPTMRGARPISGDGESDACMLPESLRDTNRSALINIGARSRNGPCAGGATPPITASRVWLGPGDG